MLAASGDPWAVTSAAGALARCALQAAPRDLGLTDTLQVVGPDHAKAVARVPAGAPMPAVDRAGRRRRGAWDTPPELARQVVAEARAAARGPLRSAQDPACGPGAFLVACAEAGFPDLRGGDVDAAALAVAQVAVPRARLRCGSAFDLQEQSDVVVGNPPFVSPEHQDKALRAALRRRYAWLGHRFDLSVPFAEVAVEATRVGGGLALVLPAALLSQPYATPLRRRWLATHAVTDLRPRLSFPGVRVPVCVLALRAGGPPVPLPHGLDPDELLALPAAPMAGLVRPGDAALVDRIRRASVPLGEIAEVDTGVVAHGPLGGKARLLHDAPGPGRVPYVDARDLSTGRLRWLRYAPAEMHRPKRPALFECDKLLIQRLRGQGPVRAWLDRTGRYAGHTLTVVRPRAGCPVPLPDLLSLVQSPLVDALIRLQHGARLDLYPRDVAAIPVPQSWVAGQVASPAEAWGLSGAEVERLHAVAATPGHGR